MTWIKGKPLYSIFFILLVSFVFLIIEIAGSFYLPRYLESTLIPGIIEKNGIEHYFFNIRRIGFSGIDAGPVRIGTPDHPALMVRSITADYSLRDLIRKKVRQINLSGVTIHCSLKEGEFSFPGINLQKILNASKKAPAASSSPGYPAIPVDRVDIQDGTLLFTWKDNEYRIPFELIASPEGKTGIKTIVRIFPRNERFSFAGDVRFAENTANLSVSGNSVQIDRFADIINQLLALNLKGDINVNANAEFRLSPFSVDTVDATVSWKKIQIDYNTLEFQAARINDGSENGFKIHVIGEDGKTWRVYLNGLSMISPVPITLSDLSLNILTLEKGISAHGKAVIQTDNFPEKSSAIYKVRTPVRTTVDLAAEYDLTGKWHASFSNLMDGNVKNKAILSAEDMDVVFEKPKVTLSASGDFLNINVDWDLTIPDIHVRNKGMTMLIPMLNAKGRAELHENTLSANVRMNLPNTGMTSGTTHMVMPTCLFSGHIKQIENREPDFKGKLAISKAELTNTDASVKIKGIQAEVPFSWPFASSAKPGRFSAETLQLANFMLGSVACTIRQKGLGLTWSGKHENQLLPGLVAEFSGDMAIYEDAGYNIDALFNIPEYVQEPELDLGKFTSEAEGFLFSGVIQGKGRINITPIGTTGFAEASLKDGELKTEEGEIRIEGIYGEIRLPNLPEIESAPDQKIGFTKAAIGTIILENGEVRYKVESPKSFFIEKGSFGWCNGNIDTRSFRILAGVEDYDVTLYCAKLELAMIIQQLTTFSAAGGGTVSGRIPLAYKNGAISFTNGFLFSEPGVKGQIQITKTKTLTQGFMAGTPQFAQLDLAQEALKNYEYNWAKIELNSEKENLYMTLKFDGKPIQPLPFILDKKSGQLVRDTSGSKAQFEGIALDINTMLPLNEILQYKDILTKKMQ